MAIILYSSTGDNVQTFLYLLNSQVEMLKEV